MLETIYKTSYINSLKLVLPPSTLDFFIYHYNYFFNLSVLICQLVFYLINISFFNCNYFFFYFSQLKQFYYQHLLLLFNNQSYYFIFCLHFFIQINNQLINYIFFLIYLKKIGNEIGAISASDLGYALANCTNLSNLTLYLINCQINESQQLKVKSKYLKLKRLVFCIIYFY
ncbi:transmembrane protein, putative (macronuclear) [Tetrahymena thermophila SB210]|uniref:Transmembrane protein, putative n=1 Tax=Tetrahymena thermophila (strain SB210) TaxID=312017 RepID=W7XFJ8_TETTS|nr:transmembrane protein, putative [Tetrahymena thermophila SB210]EWS71579.1 transmembrane protein, putative [Tetrahymena thermophila SB210]|eukprot:XP_012655886.1 transmembrane protein, putative [Tetrahymena thermophila SB210]